MVLWNSARIAVWPSLRGRGFEHRAGRLAGRPDTGSGSSALVKPALQLSQAQWFSVSQSCMNCIPWGETSEDSLLLENSGYLVQGTEYGMWRHGLAGLQLPEHISLLLAKDRYPWQCPTYRLSQKTSSLNICSPTLPGSGSGSFWFWGPQAG